MWYGMVHNPRVRDGSGKFSSEYSMLARAWSDGIFEAKKLCSGNGCDAEIGIRDWFVISSPNKGLNAAADINHDEIVNAADIGLLVAAWGDAPRNPMPPSDCPLRLIP